MKIAIYHPNLHVFGGGETVALTIAEHLSKKHDVTLVTHTGVSIEDLQDFYSLDLSRVRMVKHKSHLSKMVFAKTLRPAILLRGTYALLEKYDLIFDTCTNGWFDRDLKPRTIAYIHFPLFFGRKDGLKSVMNRFLIQGEDAFHYDTILANSRFTKAQVHTYTKKKVDVVYPPVSVAEIRATGKQDRIVTIGRISPEKRLEVMIGAFGKMKDAAYELHIIASYQPTLGKEIKAYHDKLMKMIKGKRIHIHTNMAHGKVLNFLQTSKIYWHARGFGSENPIDYENFGITTVEAMAAGAVPIVINLGAQPEIVRDGKDGLTWNTPDELITKTRELIADSSRLGLFSAAARKRSQSFTKEKFLQQIDRIIDES